MGCIKPCSRLFEQGYWQKHGHRRRYGATQGSLIRRMASSQRALSLHVNAVPCGRPVRKVSRCRAWLGRLRRRCCVSALRLRKKAPGARFGVLQMTPRKPAGCPSPPTSTASSTSRFKSLISLSTLRSFRKEHSRRRGSALSFSRDCPIAAVRAMSNQILIPVSRA